MIYRTFQSSNVENGKKLTQLIVPKKFRTKVLALAHEAPMSGHLGISRTIDRVLAEFYWPGVQSDVRRFCQSCDICQRTTPKGRTTKVPLGKMPVIDEPFKRVAVDLVGPIQPATDRGNRYILTLVDFASRYPEAVALKDLKDRLQSTCELAKENLERSSQRYRTFYNKRARQRDMKEGEKVLVLLPTASNKLLMQWRGPYIIVKKVGSVDYKIDVDGKLKTFHANMLKRYVDRQDDDNISRDIVGVAVIDVENDSSTDDSDINDSPSHLNPEGPENVNICDELGERETHDIKTLLCKYSDVLTDAPGLTTLAKHEIRLTSEKPVRTKPYPLPFTSRETVCEEVRRMLETGIIEPSTSPYTSPIVIVKKKDGSNRFCIDFRAINRITEFDAETIPCADDIFV
nr:uncharacterized protein LOC117689714 [Crassostrea gigas]XP_034327266.1 uncharacterized protein LOC117689714 [Crassostrea gigas]